MVLRIVGFTKLVFTGTHPEFFPPPTRDILMLVTSRFVSLRRTVAHVHSIPICDATVVPDATCIRWTHRARTSIVRLMVAGLAIGFLLAGRNGRGEGPAEVDFSKQIRPMLAKHCYSCHGPDTKESGLGLHESELASQAADSGKVAIVPGRPNESELLRRIVSTDPSERMPPEGEGLSERQVQLLRDWIANGAEYKAHWAFQPLTLPTVPVNANRFWKSENPIDAFVEASWSKKKLIGAKPADPRTLVRRLYFDLLGVPPDLETVEAFAGNPSEDAYARLVDKLLNDPRYGERMARDWLDVVRYAETNSFERDGPKPNAWKYRDYVIESFNKDKPYDQFLIEQLAGDEVENPTPESLTATGFYRLGIWDDEPADPLQARFDEYDDLVTTIGQGILGLTMNCARCHDHKIDPIPQKDYYQLVAFLRDVTSYASRGDERGNSQIDVSSPELKQRNRELKQKVQDQRKWLREIEDTGIESMSDEDKTAAKGPDRNKVVDAKLKDHVSEEVYKRYQTIKEELEKTIRALESLPIDFRLGLAKCEPKPPTTHVLMRGSPQSPGDEVQPGFPALYREAPPAISNEPNAERGTAGRRLILAKWIASPSNRLTGRVIVNRIWQHHFGRGIVRSANNFGQMGDAPTHPELLDFLVHKLIEGKWQLKSLHRLMLMSQTYRQSSQGVPETIAADPENDAFARFNPRRLSAEEIRDSVLAVSGKLEPTMFGPSIFPDVSDDVKAGQSVPGKGWNRSSEKEQSRRSIYIHIKRSLVPPELSVFDFPETDVTCEARFLTTQAAQALNMLNGAFMQKSATHLAKYAADSRAGTTEARLKFVVEKIYSRPATNDEIARGMARIRQLQSKFQLSEDKAFREYCLVLLNSNEFVYLD